MTIRNMENQYDHIVKRIKVIKWNLRRLPEGSLHIVKAKESGKCPDGHRDVYPTLHAADAGGCGVSE